MIPLQESRIQSSTKHHEDEGSLSYTKHMPLQYGNPVCSAQGSELGYVNFLAVARETGELRHFVVRLKQSPFPNKVVPLDFVASILHGHINLNNRAGNLLALPDFTVKEFVPLSIEDWNTFQRVLQTLRGQSMLDKSYGIALGFPYH